MQDPRSISVLNEAIKKFESLVDKEYLNCLEKLAFCPECDGNGCIRLLQIEVLGEPTASSFFTFVLNALGDLKEVFGYILKFSKHVLTVYVALKTDGAIHTAMDILTNGLRSSYPNSRWKELSAKESDLILDELFNPNFYHALSSVIVIPNNTASSNAPINQKLVDLMGDEDFTALFLAVPVQRCEIKCLINELRSLHTDLSSFADTNYNFNHSFSKNTATHISKSITKSDSTSCTDTTNTTHECSSSEYLIITPGTSIPFQDLPPLTVSISYETQNGRANAKGQAEAKGETTGCSDTKTNLRIISVTTTDSEAIGYTTRNKQVIDLLTKIDSLIMRLDLAGGNTMFCFGAYFLSASSAASIRAAYTYSGLAKDEKLDIEDSFITTWKDDDKIFRKLVEELRGLNHLTFLMKSKEECVTTSTLITVEELLNSFHFPYSNE